MTKFRLIPAICGGLIRSRSVLGYSVGKTKMHWLIVCVLLICHSVTARATEGPRAIFVHATCTSGSSSGVLSSLREMLRGSERYRLLPSLDSEGHMEIVLTIYMNCVEQKNVIAVATSYGLAKCYGEKNCHLSVDGNSIKSTVCDTSAPAECGRTLFKNLDDYLKTPNASTFKLN